MIGRLKKRYIGALMLSVFIVLGIIVTFINTVNYINTNERSDIRLDFIARSDNLFPTEPESPPRDDEDSEENDEINPETPFDTRYFTVTILNDGTVFATDLERVARINDTQAKIYATGAFEKGKDSGYVDDYKYRAIYQEQRVVYIFLDASRELEAFRSFLASSIIISLIGAAIISLLVVVLANKIFHPVIESYEKQRRFITDAGHELKTPLAIIEANAEVIEMTGGETDWTRSIRKQTKRMTRLTENLVYLARMEEAGAPAEHEVFSLSELIEEVAEGWLAVAEKNNKLLSWVAMPDIFTKGSKNDIAQLISILVDNAIKYTSPGGKIHLTLASTPLGAEITCQNDVESIETGNLNVLFNRFYRRDNSRNSQGGGFGIGLSLAKSIVQNHKGKISAHSDDGKSIVFTVVLQREQQQQ